MITEMIEHRAIAKSLQRLQTYLNNIHGWYWQTKWEDLPEQVQQDIIDEFRSHEDLWACGFWKSERHRRNYEKRFLFNATRILAPLPDDVPVGIEHSHIDLNWLIGTELPAPIAMLVYVFNWSNLRKPPKVYRKLLEHVRTTIGSMPIE
jgi:hypothetical protein